MIPSFHILIATAGRPSLKYMLNSLRDQLTKEDAITIVFDGDGSFEKSMFSDEWLKGHKSVIEIIKESTKLGHWGHGVRNKYQGILNHKTTFIMHADDDDIYVKGALNILRDKCLNPNTLYIAQFCRDDGTVVPTKNTSNIGLCNIGTPCGIIPFSISNCSNWADLRGGDYHYYNNLKEFTKEIVFLDHTIYKINPVEIDLTH
jgi:hypothetical protein